MARGLAFAGADIVINSRNGDELDSAMAEILQGTDQKGIAWWPICSNGKTRSTGTAGTRGHGAR